MRGREVVGFAATVLLIVFVGYMMFGGITVYSYESTDTTVYFDFVDKRVGGDAGIYTVFTLVFAKNFIINSETYSFSAGRVTIRGKTYVIDSGTLVYSGSALPEKITVGSNVLSINRALTPVVLAPTVGTLSVIFGIIILAGGAVLVICSILLDSGDLIDNVVSFIIGFLVLIMGLGIMFG